MWFATERQARLLADPGPALSLSEDGWTEDIHLTLTDSGDAVASEVARPCAENGNVGLEQPGGGPHEFGLSASGRGMSHQ